MATATSTSLDLRGRSITTFIAFEARGELVKLADGQALELITDASEEIDNDLHAWCRVTGQELAVKDRTDGMARYLIIKHPAGRLDARFAAIISQAGLEELLSPLGFALGAALDGAPVSLYFQGPAVRVLAKGFVEKLPGFSRPFSRFARAGLTKAGHLPAQAKVGQIQALGGRIYVCGPSMQHFRVKRRDLAFDNVTVAAYLTFLEVMADADIVIFP